MAYLNAKTLYRELVDAVNQKLEIVGDQRFCDVIGKNIGSWSLKRRLLADLQASNTISASVQPTEELASLRNFDILAKAIATSEDLLHELGWSAEGSVMQYALNTIWDDDRIAWPGFTKKLDRCCRCLRTAIKFCEYRIRVDLTKCVSAEEIWEHYKEWLYTKPLSELEAILDKPTLLSYIRVCNYPRIGKIVSGKKKMKYQIGFLSTSILQTKRRKLDSDHYEEHVVE
jgi:hypothetical protein